jgi:hypothetical protein
MRKIVLLMLSCVLTCGFAFAKEVSPADQKWLTVVEKMVADGHRTVSTPSKERVDLLQQWAEQKGYKVSVAKNEKGYRATISRTVAKK